MCLCIATTFIPFADEVVPGDGTGLTGLYLEGARWDEEREELAESGPNTRFSPLPTLLIQPRYSIEPPQGIT
jgi:Dynein heavy chain C-terminal domain